MSELGAIGSLLAIFCRVGCCLMLLPGLSSARLPAAARLLLALALSLALGPLLLGAAVPLQLSGPDGAALAVIAAECLAGLAIGLAARIMFTALHMAGTLVAQLAGYGHAFAAEDGHGEPTSELGAILGAGVAALLFVLDFHHEVLAALIESYGVIGFGTALDVAGELERLTTVALDAARLALRLCMPFLVAAVLVNLAFGMLNRIAPQVPAIFISTVFVVAVLLWLLATLLPDIARTLAAEIMMAMRR